MHLFASAFWSEDITSENGCSAVAMNEEIWASVDGRWWANTMHEGKNQYVPNPWPMTYFDT